MFHYSFVRASDGAAIPLVADNDSLAIAMLGQCEGARLSLKGHGDPEYLFHKSEYNSFWCRHTVPVFRAT
jgi:hypothetical protein